MKPPPLLLPSLMLWSAFGPGCSGSCSAPKNEPTVVTVPAFGKWPSLQLLLELDPRPMGKWDVTPVANAVYLAARDCPDALAKGATSARFVVSDGKIAPAPAHPGGNACIEGAVAGKAVASPPAGPYRVVANVVVLTSADAGP